MLRKFVVLSVSPNMSHPSTPAEASASPTLSGPLRRLSNLLGGSSTVRRRGETISLFTRQLATLLQAGLPLLRALDTLARQENQPGFQAVLMSLTEQVRGGGWLSEGLARYPRLFDHLYVHLVRAGEASGNLVPVLQRLSMFLEKSRKLRKRVLAAMIYPAVVITVAVIIVILLMAVVVPRFQAIFADMLKGAALPTLTQAVISLSGLVQHHFLWVVAAILLLIGMTRWWMRTPGGQKVFDTVWLRVPVVGNISRRLALARFARTFATLLIGGVPLLEALLIAREVVGNYRYKEAIDILHDRVRDGETLTAPLRRNPLFPPLVVSLVEVGEQTGALGEMLNHVADSYEEDVDNAVAGLASIVEPVMIVLLALIVGTIVIALFLPIISIIQHLSAR